MIKYLILLDKTSGCKGGDSCCSASVPCGEWEGDCDSDAECQDGLVCGHNNCPLKPQGYWAAGEWDETDDCCYRARNGKNNQPVKIESFLDLILKYVIK